MSRFADCETVTRIGSRRATRLCIAEKPYQRRSDNRLRAVGAATRSRARSIETGWCTGGDNGEAVALKIEEPAPEALVVVDDIELARPAAKLITDPDGEGPRLWKSAGEHRRDLERVDAALDLSELRPAKRVSVPVEIEARDLHELDAVVELRVGLTRKDGYLVTETAERQREMPDVDALAAAVGIAAVDHECDTASRLGRHTHEIGPFSPIASADEAGRYHFGWKPSAIDL